MKPQLLVQIPFDGFAVQKRTQPNQKVT
jgi:hypothetical protein